MYGWVHDDDYKKEYDKKREEWLNNAGYIVIHFSNDSVLFGRDEVIACIRAWCGKVKAR